MRVGCFVIGSVKNRRPQIIDALKTLGFEVVKNYDWVVFNIIPENLPKGAKGITSVSELRNIAFLTGNQIIGLMQHIKTYWGVCYAFLKGKVPSESKTNFESLDRTSMIKIMSFGTRIIVCAKKYSSGTASKSGITGDGANFDEN